MGDDKINQLASFKAEQHADHLESVAEASLEADTARKISQQEASSDKLQDALEDHSAAGMVRKSKRLQPSQSLKTEKAKKAQDSVLVRKDEADGLAGQFSDRQGNREYRIDRKTLSELIVEEFGVGINEDSSPEEILSIIRKRLTINNQPPDVAIVDKVFEFLLEVSQVTLEQVEGPEKERVEKIYRKIDVAKSKHFDLHSVEILVAQKIIGAVDAVVETTGQTVKETLGRYRDVVHNPPDLQTLRKFYESKGYKAMILELKGLNTYLGGNLKRTNLENPELAQLAAAARKMQALLGVYRQSKQHLATAENFLTQNHILAA